MHMEFQMTDNILIAQVAGELDHHSACDIRRSIDETMDTFACRNLVLDFSKVTFMDSSGIGMVLGRYNKVKEKGGSIYLAGCSQYVKRILYMAGVFTVVPEKKSKEEAIDMIRGQEQITMEVKGSEK